MSRWDDQFEQHRVFVASDNAKAELETVAAGLADAEQTEAHARLGRVLDYVDAALKASDPELVAWTVLDQIAAHLDQITTNLQQFSASPEISWLVSANEQADALLQQARLLLPASLPGDTPDIQA